MKKRKGKVNQYRSQYKKRVSLGSELADFFTGNRKDTPKYDREQRLKKKHQARRRRKSTLIPF